MPPISQQRRTVILDQLQRAGHVTVKGLASEMDISEATVRRDLRSLADTGHLELVYGGATLPRASDYSFRSKAQRNVEAKRIIGQLAASLVMDGDSLLMDSGTTVLQMAGHLKMRRRLSVIVNSTRLAGELAGAPDLSTIVIGGQYRPELMDMVGPLATSALEQLRGFRAFIGTDGISTDFGVTANDIESAHLYRLAIRNARETILLLDHDKFRAPSLYKICELDAISRIVTDQAPDAAWLDVLNERGIEVLYPGQQSSPTTGETPDA